VDARLAETEATLQRLKEAAAGVSEKLEQINGVLDHRLEGLNTQLAFAPNTFDIDDPALIAQTDFRGGLPGIVGNGEKAPITAAGAGGVTWPPWAPAVKPSLWSRFTRSAIAIPLLLVAVIVVGAVAYKVVKNKNVVTPGVSVSQGLNSFGSAKVIAGPECHAGTTTATVQLASAQAKNGNYAMSLAGTVSNSASTTLQNTVISWTVTYADGNTATQSAPVNKGAGVPGKSTKTWFAVASHDEGSVPPASVKINSIGAEPVQPACT
ncbi:MAG TPA: hypothetical protein VG298_17920, partial [Acidimicrobiales bacterium]|nr:hypothetical protein [Acidimicrobiales bacterium]